MKKFSLISLSILLLLSQAACTSPAPPTETPSETVPPSAVSSDTANLLSPIEDNLAGQTLNQFHLEITLDPEEHKLIVSQSLAYHNNAGVELSELYFNLIPNAFQENGGGVDLDSVMVGNTKLSLEQVKQTVYKMVLPAPLGPDETLNIQMEYVVHIPNIQNRFGYQDHVYNLGNFIVTPAVYGGDGWAVEPYVNIGDAFYTDIANYSATINTPDGYTVAATGTKTADGGFTAEKVRDFAFCASSGFDTLADTLNGTSITVYYGDNMTKTANRVMETAKKALSLYSDLFGAYPNETLSIVLNGLTGGVNGMEYPTLIMIAPEITLERLENELGMDIADDTNPNLGGYLLAIDRVVVHEIAHQWFYGIVGNDQIRYPWLDEGMCRFAEYLYEEKYPPKYGESFAPYHDTFETVHIAIQGGDEYTAGDTKKLTESLYDWYENDPMSYSRMYEKGGSLFYQMMTQMGNEEFLEALREYVDKFAYGFVTPESFEKFWNERSDFSVLFDLYLG